MRPKSETRGTAEQTVKDIRRATRKHHLAEEKIRIVLEGLRCEYSIAELRRREGIAESLYYSWSKEFLVLRIFSKSVGGDQDQHRDDRKLTDHQNDDGLKSHQSSNL
jgi:transposase